MRLAGFLSVICMLVAVQVGSAEVFNLNQWNTANLCGGTSCGTVTVTFAGGTIHVAIAVAPNFIFGQGGAFGFNTTGQDTGVVISSIVNGTDFSDSGGGGNMDGFGRFEHIINGPAGKTDSSLSFDVTRPTAAFTGVADLHEDSTGGTATFFAAHIANSGNTLTGFAGVDDSGGGGPPQIIAPEPDSIALFGTVLFGVCLSLRKWRTA
jgi:hypothetical protein